MPPADRAPDPRHDGAWHDRQYDNRARIPGALAVIEGWGTRSAAARERLDGRIDLAYGEAPSERADVFAPRDARGAPVLVWIHGGYWRALDKRDQSFVAEPFVDAGAVVVVPNYALAPQASVESIVLQVVQAVAWTRRRAGDWGGDPARLVVAGHSAGGHLAAMAVACDWPSVAADLPADTVRTAVSVSGLFELEPIRRAPFLNRDLRLDAASAARLSPAGMPAPTGRTLHAFVGGAESEEFLRQNRAIRAAWGARVVPTCAEVPGRNHLDVLDALVDPRSRLQRTLRASLGLPVSR
jgi:arylformamidase